MVQKPRPASAGRGFCLSSLHKKRAAMTAALSPCQPPIRQLDEPRPRLPRLRPSCGKPGWRQRRWAAWHVPFRALRRVEGAGAAVSHCGTGSAGGINPRRALAGWRSADVSVFISPNCHGVGVFPRADGYLYGLLSFRAASYSGAARSSSGWDFDDFARLPLLNAFDRRDCL